jgi:Tfp pilus assembly protein PilX
MVKARYDKLSQEAKAVPFRLTQRSENYYKITTPGYGRSRKAQTAAVRSSDGPRRTKKNY